MDLAWQLYQRMDWEGVIFLTGRALQIANRARTYITESTAWGSLPYDLRSLAFYYTGQFDKAMECLKEALKLSPNNERLKTNLKRIREACDESTI